MNKRNIVLVLAILVMAIATTWAQVPALGTSPYGNPTGSPTTSTTGANQPFDACAVPGAAKSTACPNGGPGTSGAAVDVLGGHGARGGCMFCHTPHSTGRNDATATKAFNGTGQTVAGGPYGTSATWAGQNGFTWQAATVGQSLSGGIYLWNRAMTNVVYQTWDGKNTFGGGSTYTPDSPEVHTLLCMTCHDNSMSSYAMTLNANGQHGGWGALVTTTNGSTSTSQDPGTTAIASLDSSNKPVWGQGDLSRSHPVHTKYSGSSLWKVSINADKTVSYNDADTNQIGDSGFYGHPARLYSDGTDVYIECTSCHNPHRQTSPAYKMKNGSYTVGAFGTTENYIRGPFSATDGTISAGFCRSCHYSKSPEYIQNNGVAK